MKRLKIITVCGFGVGSSLVLKMQLDDLLRARNINAEVTPSDITSAAGEVCDMIFTSQEFAQQLSQTTAVPVYAVRDFLDKEQLDKILSQALEAYGA